MKQIELIKNYRNYQVVIVKLGYLDRINHI